jgi:hypothetical protein
VTATTSDRVVGPQSAGAMRDRLARIRARRQQHEEELVSLHWFTVALLAVRWGVSETTVRAIPATELPYKTFGAGELLKRRRFHPDDVARYESHRVGSAA